ncbi:ERF family protein [Bacillus subtilis]
MNIYQKLIEVRKAVPYLKKEDRGGQYSYNSSSQVVAAIREKMDELSLLLIPRIIDKNVLTETVENKDQYGNIKKRTTYFTELTMEYKWIDAENPEEEFIVPFYAQGVDIAGEKGVGKALTYAEKYYLLKQFNVPTDDMDPDQFQQKVEESKPPKPITPEQLEELEKLVERFSEIRNVKKEQVYTQALGVTTEPEKIPEGLAYNLIGQLKHWIKKATKETA